MAHTVWRRLFCTPPGGLCVPKLAGRAVSGCACQNCGPHISCAVPYPTELVHLIRVLGQSEAALDVFPVTSPFCRLTPAFSLSWPSSLFLPHFRQDPVQTCSSRLACTDHPCDCFIASDALIHGDRLLSSCPCPSKIFRLTPPLLQRHISSVSFVSELPRCSESPRKLSNAAELQPEASSRQPTLPRPKDRAPRDNSLRPLARACALL